ncbi:MAG: hypothetical protein A2934_02285 [Candidatus Sungbacteria bacterium RIFCSPLOWO2_01_FULL_47_10]|uniref:PEGA domain-containing protein n=1 Tax=Candidatus Sungbacteria bacterium RIFCSPLOWO2_01_FULL_47_10 TaxID=1802276 RepID=A0A1G2KYG6_9BACT|nr:MAG: hypothetical protein A2934_02285 [Candidatus Sungbacteria bacterium RIFCSPLOWO2_01_FULL_47_10]
MVISKIKRRTLFYACVGVFLVLSTFVMLYAFGYYINFRDQTLTKTGGIFVKSSNASGIKIFLGGELVKETLFIMSGALLANLAEGEYVVEIQKDGFLSWKKKINVQKEVVTEIRNIFLVPDRAGANNATSFGTTTSRYSLLSLSPDETALLIRDQGDGLLLRANIPDIVQKNGIKAITPEKNILSAAWNKDSTRILMKELGGRFSILDPAERAPNNTTPLPESLDDEEKNKPARVIAVEFDPAFSGVLLLDDSGVLSRFNYAQKGTTSVQTLLENVNSFAVSNDTVLLLFQNGFFGRLRKNEDRVEVLGRKGVYFSGNNARMHGSPEGGVYLIDESGGLFVMENDDLEIQPQDGSVLGAEFDAKSRKLLYWKEGEFFIVYLKDEQYQPYREKGTRVVIPFSGGKIKNAAWYGADGEHIVFLTDDGVYITDIDGRGGYDIKKIIDGTIRNFFISAKNKRLYWDDGRMVYETSL